MVNNIVTFIFNLICFSSAKKVEPSGPTMVDFTFFFLSCRAVARVKKPGPWSGSQKNDPKNDDPGHKIFVGSGARVIFFYPRATRTSGAIHYFEKRSLNMRDLQRFQYYSSPVPEPTVTLAYLH